VSDATNPLDGLTEEERREVLATREENAALEREGAMNPYYSDDSWLVPALASCRRELVSTEAKLAQVEKERDEALARKEALHRLGCKHVDGKWDCEARLAQVEAQAAVLREAIVWSGVGHHVDCVLWSKGGNNVAVEADEFGCSCARAALVVRLRAALKDGGE
jgi:hypothetical protein